MTIIRIKLKSTHFWIELISSGLFIFLVLMGWGCGQGKYRPLSLTSSSIVQPSNSENEDTHSPPSIPKDDKKNDDRFYTKGTGGTKGRGQLSCEDGTSYRLFVPSSYVAQTGYPVLIFLHGAGDNFVNFDNVLQSIGWFQTAEKNQFIVMTPNHHNPERDSFLHLNANNQFDAPATREEVETIMKCVYYSLGAKYNIDTEKIHFIGFSEGAVVTGYAALVDPWRIKSVAMYGGAINHGVTPPRLMPTSFLTGTNDFSFSAIQEAVAGWVSANHPVNKVFPSGIGHSFSGLNSRVNSEKVWEWLNAEAPEVPAVKSNYDPSKK